MPKRNWAKAQQLCRSQVLAVHIKGRAVAGQDFADLVLSDLLQLAELLIQYSQLHGLAPLDLATGRFDGASDQTQQRRLARSVGAKVAALAPTDSPERV